MVVKLILNILINIALFTLLLCLIWAFNHAHYTLLAGAIVTLALFVYFKIRMIKTIRELTRRH